MKDNKKQVFIPKTHYSKDDAYQTLSTINSWINNFDSKSSFALAFIGVLLGFTFNSNFPDVFIRIGEITKLSDLNCCDVISAILIVGLYLTSLITLISLMLVIIARTKNPNKSSSVFFFGTISSVNLKDYKKELLTMSDNEILNDLVEQIHTNSKICTKKAKYYNFGMRTLLVTVSLWFICMVFRLL